MKARDTISKRITGKKGGKLDDENPVRMEEQMKLFAQEVDSHGWEVQGPEACRLFRELLTPAMKKKLKKTSCYRAILSKTQDTFRAN